MPDQAKKNLRWAADKNLGRVCEPESLNPSKKHASQFSPKLNFFAKAIKYAGAATVGAMIGGVIGYYAAGALLAGVVSIALGPFSVPLVLGVGLAVLGALIAVMVMKTYLDKQPVPGTKYVFESKNDVDDTQSGVSSSKKINQSLPIYPSIG